MHLSLPAGSLPVGDCDWSTYAGPHPHFLKESLIECETRRVLKPNTLIDEKEEMMDLKMVVGV